MHFVTGGAFNGKRAWVKDNYVVNEWISAYDGKDLRVDCSTLAGAVVVMEGLEQWTRELTEKMSMNEAREFLQTVLHMWQAWENETDAREIILIGTDIMKGIVPMSEQERNWRDITGWFYQDIVQVSKRVDIIWYGIHQTIKGES